MYMSVLKITFKDERCVVKAPGSKTVENSVFQAQRGLQLDVISFNSAMSACGSASEWPWALQLFDSLTESQLESDLITFNALITACEWTLACEFLQRMEIIRVERDAVSYNVPRI